MVSRLNFDFFKMAIKSLRNSYLPASLAHLKPKESIVQLWENKSNPDTLGPIKEGFDKLILNLTDTLATVFYIGSPDKINWDIQCCGNEFPSF